MAGRQLIQKAVELAFAARSQTSDFYQSQDDGNSVFQPSSELSSLNLVHRDLVNKLPISVLFDFSLASPSV